MAPGPARHDERRSFAEAASSLWDIALGPVVWALYFLFCYTTTAIVCAKLGGAGPAFGWLRLAIGAATLLALAVIAWIGWRAWRQWDFLDDLDYEHDAAVTEDRHELLGHAGFLLAGLAFVGVLYVAMPALFFDGCR